MYSCVENWSGILEFVRYSQYELLIDSNLSKLYYIQNANLVSSL